MRYIIVVVLSFFVGFFVHALFFPDFFYNALAPVDSIAISANTPKQAAPNMVKNITTIEFDGTAFSQHAVNMEVSRYLVVINKSKDTLMWISSNNPDLATTRGYGYLEQVKTRIDEKGQVIVADTNNPKERVVITVK